MFLPSVGKIESSRAGTEVKKMKNKIMVWTIISIIAAVISLGCIIGSMFIDISWLLTVGLALMVLGQLASMHVKCLKKKNNA